MARFSDEQLRKLKDETDIVALIESYGTKLKERGNTGSQHFIGDVATYLIEGGG